ncbi:hypothetical protein CsSME_00011036 [Camellia sinensis var. sinensis]
MSQSRAHIKGESSRVGPSAGVAAGLAEEAEFDATAAGDDDEAPVPPPDLPALFQQFAEAMIRRLDFLDARFDAFDGRLGQIEETLTHLACLIQSPRPPDA